jgi:hypothetical protein
MGPPDDELELPLPDEPLLPLELALPLEEPPLPEELLPEDAPPEELPPEEAPPEELLPEEAPPEEVLLEDAPPEEVPPDVEEPWPLSEDEEPLDEEAPELVLPPSSELPLSVLPHAAGPRAATKITTATTLMRGLMDVSFESSQPGASDELARDTFGSRSGPLMNCPGVAKSVSVFSPDRLRRDSSKRPRRRGNRPDVPHGRCAVVADVPGERHLATVAPSARCPVGRIGAPRAPQ